MDTNALVDTLHEVQGQLWVDKADEKVAVEVTALRLTRDKTTIPVPRVQAWGLAVVNALGLGPFIRMDFIDGVSLSDVLRDPNAERPMRVIREDISDGDLEVIYRQMANFLLQLFELDFEASANGGVDTFGDRSQGFASTTEYAEYVVGQDWEQLVHQANSALGFDHAQNIYVAFNILKSMVPDMINSQYDRSKFKLICDDLGLANLIVRSREDLTVVGVVDLEWSYIGPAQLFGSAPWWLLQDRPVNSTWDYDGDEAPPIAARYFKCLEIFKRVLKEEEKKTRKPGYNGRELSDLVQWSEDSGAMWLHTLLSSGFNDHCSFPFMQLRRHIGAAEWTRRWKEVDDEEVLTEFATRKMGELDGYDQTLEKMEEDKALVESGDMTKEHFIAKYSIALGCKPRSTDSKDETRYDKGLFYNVISWLVLQGKRLIRTAKMG